MSADDTLALIRHMAAYDWQGFRAWQLANLVVDIRARYGLDAWPNRHGHLVMAKSDLDELQLFVRIDRRLDAVGRGYYLGAVPIVAAPDWACNPQAVARARLVAALRIALRLRQIAAWLAGVCRRDEPQPDDAGLEEADDVWGGGDAMKCPECGRFLARPWSENSGYPDYDVSWGGICKVHGEVSE